MVQLVLGLAKSICLCFIIVINLISVSSLWCLQLGGHSANRTVYVC